MGYPSFQRLFITLLSQLRVFPHRGRVRQAVERTLRAWCWGALGSSQAQLDVCRLLEIGGHGFAGKRKVTAAICFMKSVIQKLLGRFTSRALSKSNVKPDMKLSLTFENGIRISWECFVMGYFHIASRNDPFVFWNRQVLPSPSGLCCPSTVEVSI